MKTALTVILLTLAKVTGVLVVLLQIIQRVNMPGWTKWLVIVAAVLILIFKLLLEPMSKMRY